MKEMNNKVMIVINSHAKEREEELDDLKNKQTDMVEELNKKVIGVIEYLEELLPLASIDEKLHFE